MLILYAIVTVSHMLDTSLLTGCTTIFSVDEFIPIFGYLDAFILSICQKMALRCQTSIGFKDKCE